MDNALIQGFERYYNSLVNYGYISLNSVNKLLVASWIRDVLNGKYDILVSEEDYSILNDLYQEIEGNCLVPYQNYCRDMNINIKPNGVYVRITEDSQRNRPRMTEDNNLKIF